MSTTTPFVTPDGVNQLPVMVAVNADGTPISAGGGGGGGDASAANQVTGNNSLASIDSKATTSNTSLGSIDTKTPAKGSAAMAGSSPVTLATDDTVVGAKTETAPASDTASSGLNGRLQRIAQNLTTIFGGTGAAADSAATTDTGTFSLVALFKRLLQKITTQLPAALGAQTSANSLSVVPASDAVAPVGSKTAVIAAATMTRPADTTAYAVGDMVANNTTAGSVTPIQFSNVVRSSGGTGVLRRLRLKKSGVSATGASFRVHLFRASPTAGAGDNAAFAVTSGSADYLGKVDITTDQSFGDGAAGFSDVSMGDIQINPAATSLFALLEARGAYTPANAETFILTAEILQD